MNDEMMSVRHLEDLPRADAQEERASLLSEAAVTGMVMMVLFWRRLL